MKLPPLDSSYFVALGASGKFTDYPNSEWLTDTYGATKFLDGSGYGGRYTVKANAVCIR